MTYDCLLKREAWLGGGMGRGGGGHTMGGGGGLRRGDAAEVGILCFAVCCCCDADSKGAGGDLELDSDDVDDGDCMKKAGNSQNRV